VLRVVISCLLIWWVVVLFRFIVVLVSMCMCGRLSWVLFIVFRVLGMRFVSCLVSYSMLCVVDRLILSV